MRILLVEDDDFVREVLAELLCSESHDVDAHATAECVLAQADTCMEPDVVVTDVNLGSGMNGFALGSILREHWLGKGIVYISAVASQLNDRRLGTNERFIAKPFHLATLLDAARDVSACRHAVVS